VRVYISVDMEGIAGVSHPNPTGRDDSGYPGAVDLMVGEANAAIEGIGRWRNRRPRERQPRRHVQPSAG
jgi:D-aminopeptidase